MEYLCVLILWNPLPEEQVSRIAQPNALCLETSRRSFIVFPTHYPPRRSRRSETHNNFVTISGRKRRKVSGSVVNTGLEFKFHHRRSKYSLSIVAGNTRQQRKTPDHDGKVCATPERGRTAPPDLQESSPFGDRQEGQENVSHESPDPCSPLSSPGDLGPLVPSRPDTPAILPASKSLWPAEGAAVSMVSALSNHSEEPFSKPSRQSTFDPDFARSRCPCQPKENVNGSSRTLLDSQNRIRGTGSSPIA